MTLIEAIEEADTALRIKADNLRMRVSYPDPYADPTIIEVFRAQADNAELAADVLWAEHQRLVALKIKADKDQAVS